MNAYSTAVTRMRFGPLVCACIATVWFGCGHSAEAADEGEKEGAGQKEGETVPEAGADEAGADEAGTDEAGADEAGADEAGREGAAESAAHEKGEGGPIHPIAELDQDQLDSAVSEAKQAERDRDARLGRHVERDTKKPGHGEKESTQDSEDDGREGKGKKPAKKHEATNGKLPIFYDAAEMADLENPAAGVAVIAYRRSPVTGLLSVVHERALDETAAVARVTQLEQSGYARWPPRPAPELTFGSGRDDLVNCPFIIEALVYSDPFLTGHGEDIPRTQVTCAQDLQELQRVVTRNVAIELLWAHARPCRVIMSPVRGGPGRAALARGTTAEVSTLRNRCRKVRLALAPLIEAAQRGAGGETKKDQ